MRVSSLYFAAEGAARDRLTPEAEALIAQHDECNDITCRFIRDGKKGPEYDAAMAASCAASDAVEANALARVVMELRRAGNRAAHEEWLQEQALASNRGGQS